MLIPLALMLALPQANLPISVRDGGFCLGRLGWLAVPDPARYQWNRGPDFVSYRYDDPDGSYWVMFAGGKQRVGLPSGRILMRRNSVTIRSEIIGGHFRGYLVKDNESGQENEFSGPFFKNTPIDRAFFERIDFSAAGVAKCESYNRS